QQAQRNTARAPSTGSAIIPASWSAPAEGRIVANYGAQIAGGPPAQGATVRTRPGAQVSAPASGQVAYAGPFRSYGQVLILNLDGGYALTLTGMDVVRARVGETVVAGQPLGEMAVSATSPPDLYVEVRRNGRTINPARWLSARGLAAAASPERSG